MAGCFICAFAKSRKTTVRFVMSVRLSIRPHGTNRLPLDGFLRNFIREHFFFFRKSVYKSQVSLKAVKYNGILLEDLYTFMIISPSFLLIIRYVSDML